MLINAELFVKLDSGLAYVEITRLSYLDVYRAEKKKKERNRGTYILNLR